MTLPPMHAVTGLFLACVLFPTAVRAAHPLITEDTGTQGKGWAFHVHLGHLQHRNAVDEREDIWHASFSVWREFGGRLKIAGDIGANTNTDRTSNNETAFLILGLIYSVTDDFDLDAGVKKGLTNPETDYTLLGGVTFRF